MRAQQSLGASIALDLHAGNPKRRFYRLLFWPPRRGVPPAAADRVDLLPSPSSAPTNRACSRERAYGLPAPRNGRTVRGGPRRGRPARARRDARGSPAPLRPGAPPRQGVRRPLAPDRTGPDDFPALRGRPHDPAPRGPAGPESARDRDRLRIPGGGPLAPREDRVLAGAPRRAGAHRLDDSPGARVPERLGQDVRRHVRIPDGRAVRPDPDHRRRPGDSGDPARPARGRRPARGSRGTPGETTDSRRSPPQDRLRARGRRGGRLRSADREVRPGAGVSCRRAVVSGRVQGVGFRYFAERAAKKAGVAGWVRNLPDGRVETVVEGSDGAVEAYLAEIRKGPFGSRVSAVTVEGTPSANFASFDI